MNKTQRKINGVKGGNDEEWLVKWTSSPQKFYFLFLSHAIESLPNINLPKRVRTDQAKTL